MALTLPTLLDRLADQEAERIRAQQAAGHPGQNDCDVCGLVGAGSFGFGCFIGRRGVWACDDLDCRAEAKARAKSHRQLVAAE